MALDDPLTILAIGLVVTIALVVVIVTIFAMRRREKKDPKPEAVAKSDPALDQLMLDSPFRVNKSIRATDAVQAKDELRILDLEREILGGAIRHLYEAHAEGKISEMERDRLAGSYKQRMMTVKESIEKDQSIVALHELESMQEELMKLFSERFGELSSKVDELRGRIDVRPVKEVKVQIPKAKPPVIPDQMEKDEEEEDEEENDSKPKRRRRSPSERSSQKTEAEKRIDQIRNEVEKVLDKLGQMEMES